MPTKRPAAAPAPAPQQEAMPEATRRPTGRPPRGSRALTHAERQTAYRRRLWEAEMAAYAKPEGKATKDVVKALSRYLTNLDDPAKEADRELDRSMAERAVKELCSRYKLRPKLSR